MPNYDHEQLPVASTEQGKLQPEQAPERTYQRAVFAAVVGTLAELGGKIKPPLQFTLAANLALAAVVQLMPLLPESGSNKSIKVFTWGNVTLKVNDDGLSEEQREFLKECRHAKKIKRLKNAYGLEGKNNTRMILTYSPEYDAYKCSEIMTHAEYDKALKKKE